MFVFVFQVGTFAWLSLRIVLTARSEEDGSWMGLDGKEKRQVINLKLYYQCIDFCCLIHSNIYVRPGFVDHHLKLALY